MDFKNRIKGSVTQTLMRSLLEDAGYRVIPLGIEEVIREIKSLSRKEYIALDLSRNLRCLPDFLIADDSLQKHWLVEVKYRRKWDEFIKKKLGEQLISQVGAWQPLFLTLFLGSFSGSNDMPSKRMRIAKLVMEENKLYYLKTTWIGTKEINRIISLDGKKRCKIPGSECVDVLGCEQAEYEVWIPWDDVKWDDFKRFQDEFQDLNNRFQDSTLIRSLKVLDSCKELDFFEQ